MRNTKCSQEGVTFFEIEMANNECMLEVGQIGGWNNGENQLVCVVYDYQKKLYIKKWQTTDRILMRLLLGLRYFRYRGY